MEGFVQKKAPVVAKDYEGMSFETARVIRDAVKEDPDLLLSLAAGSSAIRTYEILGEMQARGEVDFSRVRFVQLDEWLDLKDRSEDCASFLRKHFFGPLGIREEQIVFFDIDAEDLAEECRRIDRYVEEAGGIGLMLLGIGMNGHVALNEPGDPFDQGTHVVTLSETTKTVGQKYFSEGMELTRGMTLGMRQVFGAKKVILQAGTEKKADIIARLYHESPGPDFPASVIFMVEDGCVILDRDAASKIQKEEKNMKEILNSEKAPAAIGPYSQAVAANGIIFVSGQLPIDPATGTFAGDDIASQTRQSLTNIQEILKSRGLSMDHVVKTTVLLKDIGDFAAMNEVYAEFFTGDCPARAAFQAAALPRDARVEIEAVAVE